MPKNDVKFVLTHEKQILSLAQSLEKHLKSIINLIVTINAYLSSYSRVLRQKQYVGETIGKFRFRWNNCKFIDKKYTRNEDCFQEHLLRYFHSGEHTGFLENIKTTLTDKTHGPNSMKRLLEERS